jgi:branched-chain amino acid transport system permease protein
LLLARQQQFGTLFAIGRALAVSSTKKSKSSLGTCMQVIINGLISGAAIGLLALGFQACYLPTRVFFVAAAGIYSLAPFIAYSAQQATGSLMVGAVCSLLVSAVVALLLELLVHAPLDRRKAASSAHLVASLGVQIAIVAAIAMIWGNQPKTLRQGLDTVTKWNGLIIAGAQWVMLLGSILSIGMFLIFLKHADLGLRLRALADNPTQFALLGYDTNHYRRLAFVCSSLLVGLASLITAYDLGFDPHRGLNAVLLAIVAVIIGGRSTFIGPVIGGLILGLVRSQIAWHFSARWQEPASFALLALALLFLPNGILGDRQRLEAE